MNLKKRLDACAATGGLSTADLAMWLDLPYATVRSYRRGIEPYPARRPQIDQRLLALERAIKSDPRLPVPLCVKISERRQYLLSILGSVRDARHTR
jgi:hypothetical protein